MALILNADWTAEVAGKMHKYKITNSELASRCVYKVDGNGEEKSYSAAYLSTVMNGNKEFESEESAERTKERILSALNELIDERLKEVETDADDSDNAESSGNQSVVDTSSGE